MKSSVSFDAADTEPLRTDSYVSQINQSSLFSFHVICVFVEYCIIWQYTYTNSHLFFFFFFFFFAVVVGFVVCITVCVHVSKARRRGFSPGTPVSSPPSSVQWFSQ